MAGSKTSAPALRRHPTYDGAGQGRRTLAWAVGNPGAVAALAYSQESLRAKSRDLVRRNAWAAAGARGLRRQCDRHRHQAAKHGGRCRTTRSHPASVAGLVRVCRCRGLTDFYGLQALACRAMLEGGEALVRLRWRRPEDGLPVALQIQVLEAEHLPMT
jgi:capsid protein